VLIGDDSEENWWLQEAEAEGGAKKTDSRANSTKTCAERKRLPPKTGTNLNSRKLQEEKTKAVVGS